MKEQSLFCCHFAYAPNFCGNKDCYILGITHFFVNTIGFS